MNKYVVDFIGISDYIHMSCTLALSHRLAWFLELTGVNLRALGVNSNHNCQTTNSYTNGLQIPVLLIKL